MGAILRAPPPLLICTKDRKGRKGFLRKDKKKTKSSRSLRSSVKNELTVGFLLLGGTIMQEDTNHK